jgi:hypothetical protein
VYDSLISRWRASGDDADFQIANEFAKEHVRGPYDMAPRKQAATSELPTTANADTNPTNLYIRNENVFKNLPLPANPSEKRLMGPNYMDSASKQIPLS